MIDLMRLLDHCIRFTHINTHLCDYGRQSALIAALVLKRRGGYMLECEVNRTGEPLPVQIVTFDQKRSLSNGFVGQWFKLIIRGHRQVLEAEFVVNFESVPRIFTGLAQIAHTTNQIFLPQEMIRLIVSFEEQGQFEKASSRFSDPIFLNEVIAHITAMSHLANLVGELELMLMGDLIQTDPIAAIEAIGPERFLEYMMRSGR